MSQQLKSQRLSIALFEPGERYKASRFDWTSGIGSIVLDEKYEFCSAEFSDPVEQVRRGSGMHCEFGIKSPIGYEDCPVGERFPKIGVGWIRKADDLPYDFFRLYDDIEHSPYEIIRSETPDGQLVRIVSEATPRRGYGWKLVREYIVADNRLVLATQLENAGRLPIETDEYCHNFLSLGGTQVDGDYRLSLNFAPAAVPEKVYDPEGIVSFDISGIPALKRSPAEQFYVGGLLPLPKSGIVNKAGWVLSHGQTGLTVSESVEGPCTRFDLWGRSHVFSPEIYVKVSVQPAQSISWTRNYEFSV